MTTTPTTNRYLPIPETCDRCHETISAEALRAGWPIAMEDGVICPSCYGDEAFCAEGHVLPADSDSSDCSTCDRIAKIAAKEGA